MRASARYLLLDQVVEGGHQEAKGPECYYRVESNVKGFRNYYEDDPKRDLYFRETGKKEVMV